MITRKEMTRMLLKEGLLSCLANNSFETVTVTSLCKASGITRSTFYLHYSNIMEIVDDLVDDAIAYPDQTASPPPAATRKAGHGTLPDGSPYT